MASEGFGLTVEAYRRSRPSYPPEAVAWLINALRIGPKMTVVDVGAGTGKFTGLLLETGASLIAVEPIEAMRAAFAEELPDVSVLAGRAESLPLRSASADAIVVAQAFHWFDPGKALPELWRVLRPAARLGVIWNVVDTSVDWVREFDAIIAVPRVGTPHPSAAAGADLGEYFGPPQVGEFKHSHVHDRASLLERVASMSFVAVRPDEERERIFEAVATLIDSHPQLVGQTAFELPYVTGAFWAERLRQARPARRAE